MRTKYFPIKKDIIQESKSYEFSIYTLCSDKKDMDCFKVKGLDVTREDKKIIDTANVLYVIEEEHLTYQEYLATMQQHKEHKSFHEKTSAMYTNASAVLNNLFSDPETLGNYEAAKSVVNDVVGTILDDEFTLESLMKIATHDYYTHTHSINVTIYALSLGSFLGLKGEDLSNLGEASILHDLGKSKVDVEIINKNGKLTKDEFDEMKKHPLYGYSIALKLGIKNRDILEGIRHHHEKMDGTGYPLRMRGENIPYFARIVGICDIFDALTSRRSYKAPMTSFDALLLMKTSMKEHVDTKLLNSMILMFR